MVLLPTPPHLCSIISIAALGCSKWTVLTWRFLATAAGDYVIKCFQLSAQLRHLNSCVLISNYWKWKRNWPECSMRPVWDFKCCRLPSKASPSNSQLPVQVSGGIWWGMLTNNNNNNKKKTHLGLVSPLLCVPLNKDDKSATPGMWIYDMFLFIFCHGTLFNIRNCNTEL